MREIALNKRKLRHTVFSYGDTRTGKTRWAATWPKPVFLSEASEGGWSTIEVMPSEAFHDPEVKPLIYAMDTITDINDAIANLVPQLIKAGKCQTVVLDSLTFVTDLFLARLSESKDPRQDYQALQSYLRALRVNLHALPVNVLWLGLVQAPDAEKGLPGLPLMAGSKNAPRFVAGCDNVLYHRTQGVGGGLNYEIRTRPFAGHMVGTRWPLPDPLGYINDEDQFVVSSTYRDFSDAVEAVEATRQLA